MIMIKRLRSFSVFFTSLLLLVPALASAHVIVTPSTADVGQELVFNISSPNEQQTPIVKLTLDIPNGVSDVVPTEKDGWTISTTTSGSGDTAEISSITWSAGQIPVGQREDFGFGAQLPGNATTLDWKAYQTYADGTVVHWDQKPAGSDDSTGDAGPYSETKVIDDLTATPASTTTASSSSNNGLTLFLAVVAIVVSVGSLLRSSTVKK
jgi:uncharacterized protein YcnI